MLLDDPELSFDLGKNGDQTPTHRRRNNAARLDTEQSREKIMNQALPLRFPWRQSQRLFKRGPIVNWFTVRNNYMLEGQVE